MNKGKPTRNTTDTWGISGVILLAATLLGLWIAGLTGWMAWPVVGSILKDALGYALMGMTAATLHRLWKRTHSLFSKALLLLLSLVYIVSISGTLMLWLLPDKPEMHFFEGFVHNLVSISAALAGCFVYEIKASLTGQPVEQTEEGPGTRWVIAVIKKLTMKGFLIGGGSFMLLSALWAYIKDAHPADPYLLPAVVAFGLGGVIQGIEMWIEQRFPRLAKGLSMVGVGLIIAGLYFSIWSFFYE